MQSLRQFQESLIEILTSDQIHDTFHIYQKQYWHRLFLRLQEDYPTLHRLFGTDDFNQRVTKPYLKAHPSQHWSLVTLGTFLPQWLEKNYSSPDKILILQTAWVDEALARPQTYYPPPKDLKGLLYLQPHLALLALNADLFSFRKNLLTQSVAYWMEHDFPPIQWGEKRFFVLDEEITETQYILLSAFQKGATIAQACNQIEEAPNITEWFQNWAARNWFT